MKSYWNLRSGRIIIVLLWFCSISSHAQFSEPEISLTKEEKYLYPINPGQRGSLAGNMGELRSTHFHSGIDIRTNNEIGFPVRASKSGYISRVAMSPTGYGNVIYITHPDGNTTLYGHLDHFLGPLADYVLREQYKLKTFDVDLTLNENEFVVKQGDTIAISGNSGSSGGPHVHFDIRDPNNLALNPLTFGFAEIVDVAPPVVEKVALVTLDANSRINDQFGRFEYYAYRTGNSYTISSPILASGNIGVEVLAKDKFEPHGRFYGGVNYITMRVDDKPIFNQSIEKINLEETRGIYTLMDYRVLRTKGLRFYKLYIDDGNSLPFYSSSPSSGKIHIDPEKESNVDIYLNDAFGNKSKLSFRLKPSVMVKEVKALAAADDDIAYEICENTMMVTTKPCGEQNYPLLYSKGEVVILAPSYFNSKKEIYLIDLRKYLPDSIVTCSKSLVTNFKTTIPSSTEYKYYSDWVNMTFPADALYDTLYLNASVQDGEYEMYTFGDPTIPLNRSITITIKPRKEYQKDRTLGVYRVSGNSLTYLGGQWRNGAFSFQTRELGDFTFMYDTIPPTIRAISVNSKTARFKIKDELSGIASYEATVNGNWILMHYDSKTSTIWSEQLNKSEPLKGEFKLVVTDYAGNKETFQHNIP